MDDPTPAARPRIRWFLIVGLCLFAFVPVYVASVGPACWLRERGWLTQSTISVVYAPLIVIEQRTPGLFRPIQHYVIWWIELAEQSSAVPTTPP